MILCTLQASSGQESVGENRWIMVKSIRLWRMIELVVVQVETGQPCVSPLVPRLTVLWLLDVYIKIIVQQRIGQTWYSLKS